MKHSPGTIAVGILVGAFLLNYAFVWAGFKPYLYCTFKDIGWGLFQPLQLLISLAGIIGLMWGVVTKRYNLAFLGVLVTLAAYLIPDWGRVLFALGKGC